jgi:hypothetical protein
MPEPRCPKSSSSINTLIFGGKIGHFPDDRQKQVERGRTPAQPVFAIYIPSPAAISSA